VAHIRTAQASDATACADVYAPYVLESAVSFEESVPSTEEMASRIAAAHLWLVAESEGRVVGFAYGGRFHQRAAYRWAAEVSVYIDAAHHGRGLGRRLYGELIPALAEAGFCTLCAGITQPNEASNRLHESLGFQPVGTYARIGFKHGRWHDVLWLKLELMDGEGRVPAPLRRPVLRDGAAED
jgi:phosphinothricin acetyltransferase